MSGRMLEELGFFVQSLGWGAMMTLFYSGLRLFRRLVPHGILWTALEDLGYWIAYGFSLFRMMYLENDGAIRGYALLAVFLGMVLYLQFEKFIIFLRKKLQNTVNTSIMKKKSRK